MTTDDNKYNSIENVLQCINKNYISLSDEEVKRNNKILRELIDQIISRMKIEDTFFGAAYERVFYGGSYYDGLKVGKPEEYDLDILLKLPKFANPTLTPSDISGFVHVQLKDMEKFEKQPEAYKYATLRGLMDPENFLLINKISSWFEGAVTKTLNGLEKYEKNNDFTVIRTASCGNFKVKIHKTGPAFTIKLEDIDGEVPTLMDIDLVPCFVFKSDKWLEKPFRENPVLSKSDFFIVPKRPSSCQNVARYWRLSFQEQERELISGLQNLKPALKLLKKMRDMLNHKTVASYFIKTVFLWELEKDRSFFENQLSYVFIEMLKKYHNYMKEGNVPYYWNEQNNLIGNVNSQTLENIANKVAKILKVIESNHLANPYIVAKYLVESDQRKIIEEQVVIGKKAKKQMQQFFQDPSVVKIIEVPNVVNFVSKETPRACVDVTDGSPASVDNNYSVLLSAIRMVQDSVDELNGNVNKLHEDNRAMRFDVQAMKDKVDLLTDNFKEMQNMNRMLRAKLREVSKEEEENNFDFIFDELFNVIPKRMNHMSS